jgi:hypothetical protein
MGLIHTWLYYENAIGWWKGTPSGLTESEIGRVTVIREACVEPVCLFCLTGSYRVAYEDELNIHSGTNENPPVASGRFWKKVERKIKK